MVLKETVVSTERLPLKDKLTSFESVIIEYVELSIMQSGELEVAVISMALNTEFFWTLTDCRF